MPGHVVDFGHGKKEKAAGKAALCLKIFNYVLIVSGPARKPMRQSSSPYSSFMHSSTSSAVNIPP